MAEIIPKFTRVRAHKKTLPILNLSPYTKKIQPVATNKRKQNLEISLKLTKENDEKLDITNYTPVKNDWESRKYSYVDHGMHTEKAKHLKYRLAFLLSQKSVKFTNFQIYSKVYFEFADLFPDFKEILLIFRKGFVIAALQEKDFDDFEFKNEVKTSSCDTQMILNKERKENLKLIDKLNNLTAEYDKLMINYEALQKKFEVYEKAVMNDPVKYIEAEGLLNKMQKQCQIIKKQINIIHELKNSDLKLRKLLEECKKRGINVEKVLSTDYSNIVLNPKRIKTFARSRTLEQLITCY
ncbi:hypothetical protein SteCoe_24149 [Stentor coeruleus]|uniref:Uncharacterized protein n=1 Tax=Stentor coeruleus TaxID=5963 RepID=A0A1R2BI83_9CILI|nr:hypothetical protein SteCoe_24149 [Stentor coeruleus]